jgi:enoyl-CoA hydratase/carnithine racemase
MKILVVDDGSPQTRVGFLTPDGREDLAPRELGRMPNISLALANAKSSRQLASVFGLVEDVLSGAKGLLSERLEMEERLRRSEPGVKYDEQRLGDFLASHADTLGVRTASGKLDAIKIAQLFGISREQIAEFVGVTRQAFDKTTESAKYQDRLGILESIAEVMPMVGGTPETFRAWLRKPNRRFRDNPPLKIILEGQAETVRKLVTRMTTGEVS